MSSQNHNQFLFRKNFLQKKIQQLGKEVTKAIDEKSKEIFTRYLNNFSNKKGLLIGKIQSGKTSQYISLISWAFDFDYDLAIVFSGMDLNINAQTTNRLKTIFQNFITENVSCQVLSSQNNYQDKIDHIAYNFQNKTKKIVFSVLKNTKHLEKLSQFIIELQEKCSIKVLIIDDEGDLASLDSKKFVKNALGPSKIHQQIVDITKILKNYQFLSVTATAYAQLLLNWKDWLKPDFLYFLEPGEAYFGLQEFVDNNDNILKIIDTNYQDKKNSLESQWTGDWPPNYFQEAFAYFLLGSFFIEKVTNQKNHYFTMLVHSELRNLKQDTLYKKMEKWHLLLKQAFANYQLHKETLEVNKLKSFLKLGYGLFSKEIQENNPLDSYLFYKIASNLVYDTEIVLITSSRLGKKKRQEISDFRLKNQVVIGAKLVERGITFSDLLVVFFTRRAKTVSLFDTTQQRARWFGYCKYKKFLKVFLSQKIASDFYNLATAHKLLDDSLRFISENFIPSKKWHLTIINNKPDMEITNKRRVRIPKKRFIFNNFQAVFVPLLKNENELLAFWDSNSKWVDYDNVQHKELTTSSQLSLKAMFLNNQENFAFLLKKKLGFNQEFINDIFEKILQTDVLLKIVLINGWQKERFRTCQHFHEQEECQPSPIYTGVYQSKNQNNYKGDFWLYQYPANKTKIILQVHKLNIKCQKKHSFQKNCFFYALQLPEQFFPSTVATTISRNSL